METRTPCSVASEYAGAVALPPANVMTTIATLRGVPEASGVPWRSATVLGTARFGPVTWMDVVASVAPSRCPVRVTSAPFGGTG